MPSEAIFAASPYIKRQFERHPDWQAFCATSQPYAAGELCQKVAAEIRDIPDHNTLLRVVRQIRHRETVRIAWRDLSGMADTAETLVDASDLADALTDAALNWCHAELAARHGEPRDSGGEAQQMVILGMGKLGGRELNFSSDIDLIFAFPENGDTDGKRPLDNQGFFVRLGQRLIGVLGQTTADGFAYRVDMRLRPFGEAGALALSFDAMEHYYETHGREWERYALIKARVMAGDRRQGAELLERLRPFVYRRYLDYGAVEQLRDMKAMINREAERRGKYQDVKLGSGGIREVEFTAQVFQLMRGGRIPELRERNLLKTLDVLLEQRLLSATGHSVLRSAYLFLRRTENRLQMWNDEQTHSLPDRPEQQLALAASMGFGDWTSFRTELNRHQQAVAGVFQHIFALEQQNRQPLPEHPAIQALVNSRLYNTLTDTGRNRLDRLLPALLDACQARADPEQALERCLRIIQKIAPRSGYIAMLADNPNALEQFVRLVSASLWITSQLTQHPILLDQLLDSRQLYTPLNREALGVELRQELERIDEGDTEQVMERLRQFKQAQVLRTAAADITGVLPLMKVSDQLTWIAEAVLEESQRHVWGTMTAQTGAPTYQEEDGSTHEAGFAIIGYGKLGGLELGYGSDLDIIFLHDSHGRAQQTNGGKTLENLVFYARFAQKIIHTLTTFTPAGRLYETDMRLRPSGSSGLLVSSLEAFRRYQEEKAWAWEHQALLRARAITGPASLRAAFDQIRRDILCRPRDRDALRQEVAAMRQKMWESQGSKNPTVFNLKKDPGGITDIEFMVQYLILAHAQEYPELVRWSDNVRQLESLREAGLLAVGKAEALADIYRTLRDRIHALSLQEEQAVVPAEQFAPEREYVREAWAALINAGRQ
ncbi:bifunctional [glutamate--ammonia ligase]-adenylyl-L-tyrosine phosphorylase/[glutamate--ammonia-ligase] adenylyltransferase [Candidatus Thiothrix sp. Deng01]|uniref:Bifunctional glutamine synthetase adenylyltransferase/adenylyl-removing enzyme n=1 Tax=Candidatus Thiothrix phosphatis TaxID=3112415 RepID=A0ABU6CVB3_9GAMM|nr:bifunctional [glutamate--ammonia ligase]-adenylyl-L-tyrosine phosphorylase/[glutamate--ammonia-ligase] adenylyltransferase [Candidatus Thiothrix sp. Deng01]MEB4590775.1 bifunctional [glutamate--ammonia ligase]-adenylyl-L-tyrosine phosphorylase/[glutamate--ammonia-ligase] adenylyltransferase [Candidatus Thiothrix sp. Deng01]